MLCSNPYVYGRVRSNNITYSSLKNLGVVTALISGAAIYFLYGFDQDSPNFLTYAFSLLLFITLLHKTKKAIKVTKIDSHLKTEGDLKGKDRAYVQGLLSAILLMALSAITTLSIYVFFICVLKIIIDNFDDIKESISEHFVFVKEFIYKYYLVVKKWISKVLGKIFGLINKIIDIVKEILKDIIDMVKDFTATTEEGEKAE